MEKALGKITNVKFGNVGYRDLQFGLQLTFKSNPWSVSKTIAESWSMEVKHDEYSQWTEEDRLRGYANTMREISSIMKQAGVNDIDDLKNIPVELTFNNGALESWRVLTEVL